MHASRLLHLPVPSHRQSPGPGLDGVSKGLWAITAMNLARMRRLWIAGLAPVSYTHLTLPTNREV